MKTIVKLIGAACMAGALSLAPALPAQAQSLNFSFGPLSYSFNAGLRDRGFGWQSDWRVRQRSLRIGAVVDDKGWPRFGTAHVRRCENEFRSYDRWTDTYMGFDGKRHFCKL